LENPLTNRKVNAWKAVNDADENDDAVVVKGPSEGDDNTKGWPALQHEQQIQKLFQKDQLIRKMIDFIPFTDSNPPMLVLGAFQRTLWDARNL
jgi:hypothetical protein